ncbi:MerR family transcriptional regulator [Promicromonospora iranensis]|nr:MerR family transcriptional regulator [Promicromonospora iranensis]
MTAARLGRMTHPGTADAVPPDGLTVGGAASVVGVTVRTLHHWDEVGLARPSQRTSGGHRLYDAADVARLHRVRLYRELGVPLADIGALLSAPTDDAEDSLRRQLDQVREHIRRLERSADALDRLIEARRSGILLSPEEQVEIFGERWDPSQQLQARDRWGDSEQWAQYAERAADRSPEDWRRIMADVEALHGDLATAVREGVRPGSERANALAERHRASMSTYFDCTRSMHACLARSFVDDPGFLTFYDDIEVGLAGWLRDIVDANALAHGVDPATATWT